MKQYRNIFCECRSGNLKLFCLCRAPPVLLCEDCSQQHLTTSKWKMSHPMYPIEMMGVFEREGEDGLYKRRTILTAANNQIEIYRSQETSEYQSALRCLESIKDRLDSLHRLYQKFINDSAEELQHAYYTEAKPTVSELCKLLKKKDEGHVGVFRKLYRVESVAEVERQLETLLKDAKKTLVAQLRAKAKVKVTRETRRRPRDFHTEVVRGTSIESQRPASPGEPLESLSQELKPAPKPSRNRLPPLVPDRPLSKGQFRPNSHKAVKEELQVATTDLFPKPEEQELMQMFEVEESA